jgi:hypothetical protein
MLHKHGQLVQDVAVVLCNSAALELCGLSESGRQQS